LEVRREPGRIRHVIRAALDQVIPQVERFVEMGDLRMEIQAAGQDCRTGSLAAEQEGLTGGCHRYAASV